MNTKESIQYLKHVMTLEARVYELNRIDEKLSGKINYYNNTKYEPYFEEAKQKRIDFGNLLVLMILGGILGAFIGYLVGVSEKVLMQSEPDLMTFIGYLVGVSEKDRIRIKKLFSDTKYDDWGLYMGVVIGFLIAIVMYIFKRNSVKKHNIEVAEKNLCIAINNEKLANQNTKRIQICKQEQGVIRRQCKETIDLVNKAYQLNVLHPKYQNFVAVCSLYEYLETGRCTQLTGHEGGYNIFEMEKRLDMLILKMDEVIYKLNQIQQNQHALYNAVTVSNRNADRIISQVSAISEQLGNIEHNQNLIEYNTRITSSNTEILKWMEYLKR